MRPAVLRRRAAARTLAETRLGWIDRFVTDGACAAILEELEFAFWKPSTVIARTAAGSLRTGVSLRRVSETATQDWFGAALRRRTDAIRRRVSTLLDVRPDQFEPWQAVRYRRGGRFEPHLDCGVWGDDPAGERQSTVLLYLDTPGLGGGTRFNELGILVAAQAGRLVLWHNLEPNGACDPKMLHAGVPVRRGHKTVLVTWVRQRTAQLSGE